MKKIFFCLLLCLVIVFVACATNEEWVVSVDGEKIDRGEFTVYLNEQKKSFEAQGGEDIWEADFDGVSAVEVAKNNAINTITMVKVACKQAPSLNISADKTDEAAIEERVNEIMGEFSPEELKSLSLDKNKVTRIIKEARIQSKVFDYITEGYVVNEDEFEEYFEKYKQENPLVFKSCDIREIFIQKDTDDALEKKERAVELIGKGKKIDAIETALNTGSNTDVKPLEGDLYSKSIIDGVLSAKNGDVMFFEDENGYYIISLEDTFFADEAAIKEQLRQNYISEKKNEIYKQQNDKWSADVKTEKNDKVWSSITEV
ncbi:MAG TPA: hypothetical protein DCG28_03265 [Lachnospiraceae bacterium]|nr:hypothetical protein [Lachnospiraceae bacterium]